MVRLTRTVRFAVNPPLPASGAVGGGSTHPRHPNGYAGVPALEGLGAHYEVAITCRGDVNPATGYFRDIKDIDRAARDALIPGIALTARRQWHAEPGRPPEPGPEALLCAALPALDRALGGVLESARWWLTPYFSLEATMSDLRSVVLRQRFEFAAAHRLHVPSLSDEENRRIFGKCNHPSGHGHNYVVEPAVRVPVSGAPPAFVLADVERAVATHVLARLDHTNLNVDVPEFNSTNGLNPSVENIARVCFELLRGPIDTAPGGAKLESVTVWETEKTCATYPG